MKSLNHDSVKLLICHCSATRCDRPFSVESLIATGEALYHQVSYHYYIRMNGDIIPLLPESALAPTPDTTTTVLLASATRAVST